MSNQTPAIEGGSPVRKDFLAYGRPQVTEEDIQVTNKVIRSGWLSTGSEARQFEIAFAEYMGRGGDQYIALSSCTAALHLALLTLNLQPGDEVITTDMTFAATANVILHAGAKPVLVDCGNDYNIDIGNVERAITPRTKAVIPVHFAGLACKPGLNALRHKYGFKIINDRAHAIETRGGEIGFADYDCFSFYGTKNITTACGEGGMLWCRDPEAAERARVLSLHGMNKNAKDRYSKSGFKHYEVLEAGYKYNMPDVSAAMARNQLARIDTNHIRRKSIWHKYISAFADLPIRFPHEGGTDWPVHAYHLFAVRLGQVLSSTPKLRVSRDHILDAMTREGIGCGVHYLALHRHPVYKKLGFNYKDFPNADAISDQTISLPLDAALTDQDVDDVITAFRKVIKFYIQ